MSEFITTDQFQELVPFAAERITHGEIYPYNYSDWEGELYDSKDIPPQEL
jgi:hypothetical protein